MSIPVEWSFRIEWIYALCGLLLLIAAGFALTRRDNPKRFGNASFFAVAGFAVLLADVLPDAALGAMALTLAAIASLNRMGVLAVGPSAAERSSRAERHRDNVFLPALAIPTFTVALLFGFKPWLPKDHAALICLALACTLALAFACVLLRARVREAFDASSHLLETISWPVLLPLLLAILGGVFAQTGVGEVIASLAKAVIPVDSRLACVLAYALGMALFTIVMGNAFAAFPVMTAGIGVPLLIDMHGGDPAAMGAIGMLSGYCGTLMTPMAANFNLVPAALLELRDQNAVIKAQIGTAIPLLLCNIALMNWLVFR